MHGAGAQGARGHRDQPPRGRQRLGRFPAAIRGTWSVCSDDEWGQGTGNADSGDKYAAAPDLDHSNTTVQSDITAWLNWLKDPNNAGFDGWRYDYSKGYWGGYTKIYNEGSSPQFSVGEFWPDIPGGQYYDSYPNTDWHRQILVDWINAAGTTSTAFDFTTKWQLQLAMERGELWRLGSVPGLIGWWGEKAVTFLDNHDTGSTQNHWPFPGDKVLQGYAYILTHPGIPCIFWDHLYTWGHYNAIKAMVAARKAAGVLSDSPVSVQKSEANLYAALVGSNLAMKIGSGSWSPAGSDWTMAASP
jgi:alpha-amylase